MNENLATMSSDRVTIAGMIVDAYREHPVYGTIAIAFASTALLKFSSSMNRYLDYLEREED